MNEMIERPEVIDWLMEGDPAIRWQVMRDIIGKPATQCRREQAKVATEGWGRQLLDRRDNGGTWGGGLYTPKWKSTNYTLLLLRDMGLPRSHPAGRESARLLLGRMKGEIFRTRIVTLDLCIVGMYLLLTAYFGVRDDRVEMLAKQAVQSQMPDGGWNCAGQRRPSHHGSLHTTINILDGLADYAEYGGKKAAALAAEPIRRAHEFILEHRLFKSDRTGKVINPAFTKFSFPPRWHWDVLRGLDYLRRVNAPRDERLQDGIDLLFSKRCPDGRWKLEHHHKGEEFFRLEKPGQPSRWNTLRALRVLRWWSR